MAVMSGKGGAGKTSFTAALVQLFPFVVAVDADVNASNLPTLLDPERLSSTDFFGMDVATIEPRLCSGCGQCAGICAFDAVESVDQRQFRIKDHCEGCAACSWVCPHGAVRMVPHRAGQKYVSRIENGLMVHADLIPGEDNSGKLIASIRTDAKALAADQEIPCIVIDGPPGTSCQAISSLTGVDMVLAVLEESLSGLSDYKRLAQLLNKLRLPHLVVVNKGGLNPELADQVEAAVVEHGGSIVASIPFDPEIPKSLARLETFLDLTAYRSVIESIYQYISAGHEPAG